MTTTLRIDDDLKRDCEVVLEDLGLSMSGAVTLFLKQVVKQRAIPFIISCDRHQPEMRDSCEREWTMDEIDAEIAAARKERRERNKAGA